MEICRFNNWKYIFSHKIQRLVAENYALLTEADGKTALDGIGAEKGKGAFYNHVDELTGKTEKMHVYEYNYIKKVKGQDKELHFQWITNIELTKRNLSEMIAAGRGRWKIENEGFNNQKNGLYQIQHLNSRNSNAMKNHYLLTQIADILMQLYVVWNPIIKEIKQSIKNTSSRLLESFRRLHYILRYTTVYLE